MSSPAAKSIFRTVWQALACLIAFLLFSELYLYHCGYRRAVHPGPLSAGWTPRSGSIYDLDGDGIWINIWDNHNRASRPNPAYTKPYKVLMLGCSYTYGMGIEERNTYVWRLGELLPGCDFDNAGMLGFGPYQCLDRLKELEKIQRYDAVIYASTFNHLFRNSSARKAFSGEQRSDIIVTHWGELNSAGNGVIYHPPQVVIWPLDDRWLLLNYLKIAYTCVTHPYDNDLRLSTRQKLYRLMVSDLAAQARRNGAKFGYVSLDCDPHKMMGITREQLQALPFPSTSTEWYCDILKGYQTCYRGQPGGHPNALVHRYYAWRLAKWLQQEKLIPEQQPI